MMNRSAKSSNADTRIRAVSTLFLASLVMASQGCGIPRHRCALPGAVLPQSYNLAAIWSNGAASSDSQAPGYMRGNPGTNDPNKAPGGTGDKTPDPAVKGVGSQKANDKFRLASYTEPARTQDSFDDENAAGDDFRPGPEGLGENQALGGPHGNADDTSASAPELEMDPDGVGIGPPGSTLGITTTENSGQIGFHDFFGDPFLTDLIDQALIGNQELKILAEEINIACYEVQARSGEYRPFVNFVAGAGADKSAKFSPGGAVEENLTVDGASFPDPLPDFLVATNISWELDIWRKLRNARDAASLRYLATSEGRNYVVTKMVAEIAENYFELVALDRRLATLDKTIEIQQKSLAASEAMKAGGRATELAVQRFQAEVRKNQSEKLIVQQEIVEAENRINFLCGRYPQPVERISGNIMDLKFQALGLGLPSQLLLNRTDIRQAERAVEAAGLDVRVARARFYPSLALHAGVGYRAFNAKYLFSTPESLIYNLTGDLVAPLLNKRAIRAEYQTANAKQLQAIYNYERTILNAFTEVINQMAKVENYNRSLEIKMQQLVALEASVDSATKLFQNARAEYVEVLLAQRDLQEARLVIIETKKQQLSAIVNTYQALGGGVSNSDPGIVLASDN